MADPVMFFVENLTLSGFKFTRTPGDVQVVGDCYSIDLDSAQGVREFIQRIGENAVFAFSLQEDDLDPGKRAT